MGEVHTTMHLSSKEAARLVLDAWDVASADGGGGVAAAVVDGAGDLLAFVRSDDAPLRAIRLAIMKAYTAARFGKDTMTVRALLEGSGRPLAEYGDSKFTTLSGGVAIIDGTGRVTGGFGVSGREPEQDHGLAAAVVRRRGTTSVEARSGGGQVDQSELDPS